MAIEYFKTVHRRAQKNLAVMEQRLRIAENLHEAQVTVSGMDLGEAINEILYPVVHVRVSDNWVVVENVVRHAIRFEITSRDDVYTLLEDVYTAKEILGVIEEVFGKGIE